MPFCENTADKYRVYLQNLREMKAILYNLQRYFENVNMHSAPSNYNRSHKMTRIEDWYQCIA